MSSGSRTAIRHKILRWVGASSVDAAGRLGLQLLATLVLARMLAPESFGLVALAFTVVGIVQNFVGIPFEDALAQRKVLRRAHLSSVLTASLGVAVLAILLLWALSGPIARFADAPALESVLPAAALLLLPMGPQAVFTALARRYQAFSLIAGANLFGHIAGVACALGLAWLGAGLWSLVALRVVAPTVLCLILILGMRCAVPLRLSLERLRELAAFAGLHLADRLVENLIIALFHFMVNALFGLTVLGWLNMAMRLVEPLRGAVGAMGHNIAFSFFARAQSDAEKLGQAVVGAIRDTSILTLPAFVGLAAVMPILLPLAAGPGWEPAIPIAQALALAAALGTPMGMVHTGLTALGRPVFGLISSILGLIALVLALLLIGPEGALLVGVAKLCQEAMETLYIHHPLSRILKVSPLSLIKTLSPLLPGAVAMAALVLLLGSVLAPETALSRILVLMLQVLGGAVLFLGLTALIARSRVTSLLALFRARPAAQEP